MSEAQTIGETTDVVGELLSLEIGNTVAKIRALCGLNMLTDVEFRDGSQVSVRHIESDHDTAEKFVLTHVIKGDEPTQQERFTIAVEPPDILGRTFHDWAELARVTDRIIDIGSEDGTGDNLGELMQQRSAFIAETTPEFFPENAVDDDSKLCFAGMLSTLAHEAKIQRMIQEGEAFHAQKNTP